MATYGNTSQQKLDSCHPDLIVIFQEVVRIFDNAIVYGERTPGEQFELYKQGRSLIGGRWVIADKKKVVTYKDGTISKSNHNYSPSKAVDAVPYYSDIPHIRWGNIKEMCYFAGHVKATAFRLLSEGKIAHMIKWGADWNMNNEIYDESFRDYAHFEIID